MVTGEVANFSRRMSRCDLDLWPLGAVPEATVPQTSKVNL